MKEPKYSPAPWSVKGYFQVVSAPIEKEGHITVRHGICDTETGSYVSMSWEEREANAKLIAASPELLEALQELISDLEEETLSTSINDSISRAKQAINKALGL